MYQAYQMPNKLLRFSNLHSLSLPLSTFFARFCRTSAAAVLVTASLCLAPLDWDDQGYLRFAGARAEGAPLNDEGQELDDDLLVEDDGSHHLAGNPAKTDLPQLQLITSDEEKALLGNWGDSEDEDGD
jgi:hypothetical protein